MAKRACRWCGRTFVAGDGPGRPRLYCRQSCRQRDYESRRRASELGLGEDELIMTRAELDELQDRLYMLAQTLEDAQRDLREPAAAKADELQRIIDYVMAAAEECVSR